MNLWIIYTYILFIYIYAKKPHTGFQTFGIKFSEIFVKDHHDFTVSEKFVDLCLGSRWLLFKYLIVMIFINSYLKA